MTLDTIMTKHVISVGMDTTLATIRTIFTQHKFHHLVVLEHCRLVGVISDRDLLMHMSPFLGTASERALDAGCLKLHAHQFMTRHPVTASPETAVGDAALLLMNNHVSCLPVLDTAGAVVGIVTWRDMLRWTLEHLTDNACPTQLRAQAGQTSQGLQGAQKAA